MNYLKYYEYISSWIQEEVHKAGAKGVIIGISGGIDSALVGSIAKNAFPNNSLGIIIPIMERAEDKKDGINLCKQINLDYMVIELKDEYEAMTKKLRLNEKLTKANLQARMRMTTIYAIAQEKSYLVLGTDNLAEYYLGYFTKYGDGACDLNPIINLQKSEVFEMARILKLPNAIINKAPSGGLWFDQEDEKELGFSYSDFENYFLKKEISFEIKDKIELRHKMTKHKRMIIPKPLSFIELEKGEK